MNYILFCFTCKNCKIKNLQSFSRGTELWIMVCVYLETKQITVLKPFFFDRKCQHMEFYKVTVCCKKVTKKDCLGGWGGLPKP